MKGFAAGRRWIVVSAAVCLCSAFAGWVEQGLAQVPMPLRGATVRIALGLKDKEPTAWDGQIRLSQGKVVGLTALPPVAGKAQGGSWQIRSRRRAARGGRIGRLLRPVLQATLDAAPTATVTVSTKQGEFSFVLGDLALGKPTAFLRGQVSVTSVPLSTRLTTAPTDDDWPAAAAGAEGTVWVAYTAYKNGPALNAKAIHGQRNFAALVPKGNGDQVRLLKFDGKAWSAPIPVTKAGLDVWRPTVAVDGKGAVWVIWSRNAGGNWDLYARAYTPASGKWSDTKRLTTDPGADVYAVAVTDPKTGRVAIAWQGWRPSAGSGKAGSFDILLTSLDAGRAAPEKRLARSPANEWCPSAAFDAKGTLHVAFDTYEKGNYDVKLVSVRPRGEPRTIDVAASARHEAHPNVAVDKTDRVWVAYEEAAVNWGKDTGLRWFGKKGEMLYVWREIRVRCVAGTNVKQAKGQVPAEPITAGYPRGSVGPKRRMSLPRIAFDAAGRLWLLYRRHPARQGSGERWASFVTSHAGDAWGPAVQVANSMNLLDNRPALVSAGAGGLLAVHSTDGRTGGTRAAKRNDLYCAVLRGAGQAKSPALVASPAVKAKAQRVHPNETEDVRRIRAYRATIGSKTYRLLRGEFHRHTELTSHQDMDGTLEEMWRYGLDVAGMDWIGNGDHDNGYGVEYLWWLVQKQTDIFHHPPAFTPMHTYERSVSYPSGHRNAMFAQRGIRPLPRIPGGRGPLYGTPEKGSPDIKTFYAYLKHFGGICASHTSGTGMGTDWRDHDPEAEPVVEIYQGLRQSYEHEGAPATAKNPKDSIGGYKPLGFIWNAWRKGHRLGIEVSSDHYSTHISYAVVFAEEVSRKGILDAFKKRHSYGTNDNIILDVRCGERMMGDAFDVRGKPSLQIVAIGTQPIARLSIIRGVGSDVPRYVHNAEPNKAEVKFTWTDQSPEWDKTNYYYVRVEQARPKGGAGALAWASPMWITVRK